MVGAPFQLLNGASPSFPPVSLQTEERAGSMPLLPPAAQILRYRLSSEHSGVLYLPRTHQTWWLWVFLMVCTVPWLTCTFHALLGLSMFVAADH